MRFHTTLGISILTLASLIGCERRRDEPELVEEGRKTVEEAKEKVERAGEKLDEERREEREKVAGREADEPTTNRNRAVKDITSARCEREMRCGNVGADDKYESRSACITEIGKDWRDDLSFEDCPGGVSTKELEECLSEVRNEDCNNPFDKLSRLAACRESDLCKVVPASPNRGNR